MIEMLLPGNKLPAKLELRRTSAQLSADCMTGTSCAGQAAPPDMDPIQDVNWQLSPVSSLSALVATIPSVS